MSPAGLEPAALPLFNNWFCCTLPTQRAVVLLSMLCQLSYGGLLTSTVVRIVIIPVPMQHDVNCGIFTDGEPSEPPVYRLWLPQSHECPIRARIYTYGALILVTNPTPVAQWQSTVLITPLSSVRSRSGVSPFYRHLHVFPILEVNQCTSCGSHNCSSGLYARVYIPTAH